MAGQGRKGSKYIMIGNWPKRAKPEDILGEVRERYGDVKVLAHPDQKDLEGVVVPNHGCPPPRHFLVEVSDNGA